MGFMGKTGFQWFVGVVEDRNDPEQFGRYRVRIIGYHTLDKAVMPTESLPWAIPMQPVTSAAISGVGTSPTGLVEGSSVIGFFVDGEDSQIPVIMGSFGVEDNVPGEMNPAQLLGNYVVVEHGAGEFSLLAHIQKGSVAVKVGDEGKGEGESKAKASP